MTSFNIKKKYQKKISQFKVGCKVKANGNINIGICNDMETIKTVTAIIPCKNQDMRTDITPCFFCIGKLILNNENDSPLCISGGFKIGLDIIAEEDFLKEEEMEI